MTTITIPKELAERKDLVAVPRQEYDKFVEWQEKIKSTRTFKLTPAQKRDLEQARKDYKQGKYITLEELEHELGITPNKKS